VLGEGLGDGHDLFEGGVEFRVWGLGFRVWGLGGSVLGEGLSDGLLEGDSVRALERQWMMGQGATPREGSPQIGWLVGNGNDLSEVEYLVRGMTPSPGPRAAVSSVCLVWPIREQDADGCSC